MEDEDIRIDKWLWAVRLFKSRSLATDECRKGHIMIDGIAVKPSRVPKIGDVVQVRKNPVVFSYKIKGLVGKRLNAKLVSEYMEDVTPPEVLQVLEIRKQMSQFDRDRGAGRPTKKERRDLDQLMGW
jgi:ribosome-associated heat shock protein Hsp15